MKAKIVLIRHGMTQGNQEHRYVGTTEEGLLPEPTLPGPPVIPGPRATIRRSLSLLLMEAPGASSFTSLLLMEVPGPPLAPPELPLLFLSVPEDTPPGPTLEEPPELVPPGLLPPEGLPPPLAVLSRKVPFTMVSRPAAVWAELS